MSLAFPLVIIPAWAMTRTAKAKGGLEARRFAECFLTGKPGRSQNSTRA
jgi:hypothetical protein